MTQTAPVHALPKSLPTLVAAAISVPVRCVGALLGYAVAGTLTNRGLGVPWRTASMAISIPVLILGGSADDAQALRMSVAVA